MTYVSTEVQIKHVTTGDQIISPISGEKMYVKSVESALFGMIDVKAINQDGDFVTLTLASTDPVRILEQA